MKLNCSEKSRKDKEHSCHVSMQAGPSPPDSNHRASGRAKVAFYRTASRSQSESRSFDGYDFKGVVRNGGLTLHVSAARPQGPLSRTVTVHDDSDSSLID